MIRLYRLEIWIWNNISEGYENISEDYENISEGYANISEGFYSAARPEGAEAPSPGHSPWVFMSARLAPCRGKSFVWRPEPQASLLNPSSNWLWNSANYVKM